MTPQITRIPPQTRGAGGEECFVLLESGSLRLECLVSRGAASPDGFWYDQQRPEWVMLQKGRASLRFEDGVLELSAGDSLVIPAGCRHRVESVSGDAVWLALHHEPG